MITMNPKTGKYLTGKAALDFILGEILFTPKASRILHREFGSNIMSFVDEDIDGSFKYSLEAENIQLLKKHLPEFKYRTTRITKIDAENGKIYFSIIGKMSGKDVKSKEFSI